MTEVAESARPPRRFRRYPEYESSGVAWLGDLPSHWKPKRFKFACSRSALYGANESAESYSLDGIRFLRTTDIDDSGSLVDDGAVYLPEELVQDYLLSDGDILISRSGTLGRALHYQRDVHGPCAYAGYLVRFVPKPTLDPRFAFYFTKSKVFMGWLSVSAIQSTIGNINGQKYGNLHLPDPALGEQRAIADFLDRETARIDQLIEKKQRMVEVLEASQESVRDGAVCKGLNPSSSYQESGMVWFGNVPAHWTICKFNRLVSSKVDYRGRTPEKVDVGVFLVTARNIRNGIIDYGRSREFTTGDDRIKLSNRGRPNIGDVIFTTEAPLGQIAQVDRTDVAFAQRILKFQANEKLVTNDFLAQLMMSASFQHSLRLFASGSTSDGIKSERLAHLFGLAPPMEEQLEIVAFIKRQIDRARNIVTSVEMSIDRLRSGPASARARQARATAATNGPTSSPPSAPSGPPAPPW